MTQHFSLEDFACKHCGENLTSPVFLEKLNRVFDGVPFPIPVTSGYRCSTHNQAVSTTGPHGPHTTGHAVDLGVRGEQALALLTMAVQSNEFTGVGLNQKGESRFLHLDDLPKAPGQPRPHCWTY